MAAARGEERMRVVGGVVDELVGGVVDEAAAEGAAVEGAAAAGAAAAGAAAEGAAAAGAAAAGEAAAGAAAAASAALGATNTPPHPPRSVRKYHCEQVREEELLGGRRAKWRREARSSSSTPWERMTAGGNFSNDDSHCSNKT